MTKRYSPDHRQSVPAIRLTQLSLEFSVFWCRLLNKRRLTGKHSQKIWHMGSFGRIWEILTTHATNTRLRLHVIAVL